MTIAETPRHVLSEEQLAEMMHLVRDADSVELKLTIREEAQRPGMRALQLDPLHAEAGQTFSFDGPDLALQEPGVGVRDRRVQRKGEDSTVKLRPVVPEKVSSGL